jgi:hypothetical protein
LPELMHPPMKAMVLCANALFAIFVVFHWVACCPVTTLTNRLQSRRSVLYFGSRSLKLPLRDCTWW